jgi:transposase
MSQLFNTPESLKYHLYRKETDMRKSFNGLSGLVRNELGKQVKNGDVFIFINKSRDSFKMLLWEKGGFSLGYRKLDVGTFEVPQFNLDDKSMQITADQLQFILKGIALKEIKYRRKRY